MSMSECVSLSLYVYRRCTRIVSFHERLCVCMCLGILMDPRVSECLCVCRFLCVSPVNLWVSM